MQSTNNLKCVSTNEQIRNAMTETKLSSTLSVDEKITKLTAIKAEYLISLERRGYKFKTLMHEVAAEVIDNFYELSEDEQEQEIELLGCYLRTFKAIFNI